MNPEYKRGWASTVKLITFVIVGTLGWLAGRGQPITLRFWVPLILCIACSVAHRIQHPRTRVTDGHRIWKRDWSWLWYWVMLPFSWGMMSIFSYGSGSFLRPLGVVFQRFVIGVAWSMPALPVAWVNRRWALYGLHIFLYTVSMTIIGGLDLMSAPEQECILRGLLVILPLFMVRWE